VLDIFLPSSRAVRFKMTEGEIAVPQAPSRLPRDVENLGAEGLLPAACDSGQIIRGIAMSGALQSETIGGSKALRFCSDYTNGCTLGVASTDACLLGGRRHDESFLIEVIVDVTLVHFGMIQFNSIRTMDDGVVRFDKFNFKLHVEVVNCAAKCQTLGRETHTEPWVRPIRWMAASCRCTWHSSGCCSWRHYPVKRIGYGFL